MSQFPKGKCEVAACACTREPALRRQMSHFPQGKCEVATCACTREAVSRAPTPDVAVSKRKMRGRSLRLHPRTRAPTPDVAFSTRKMRGRRFPHGVKKGTTMKKQFQRKSEEKSDKNHNHVAFWPCKMRGKTCSHFHKRKCEKAMPKHALLAFCLAFSKTLP